MNTGTFMEIVGAHYRELKTLFTTRDKRHNIPFNEDSFNTAFIKCVERFGDTIIGYDDVVKYFYVAYKHTHENELIHNNRYELCEEFGDIIDEDELKYARDIYDLVMGAVEKSFGRDEMMVYSLHKYHGWTKEDLESEGYDCTNLDERIKNIHRFVKQYSKKNIK